MTELKLKDDRKDRQNRSPLSPKLRYNVLRRDGFTCQYCGRTGQERELEIDHIIPFSKGGTNDIGNLQTACKECNRGKLTDEIISQYTEVKVIEKIVYKDVPRIEVKVIEKIVYKDVPRIDNNSTPPSIPPKVNKLVGENVVVGDILNDNPTTSYILDSVEAKSQKIVKIAKGLKNPNNQLYQWLKWEFNNDKKYWEGRLRNGEGIIKNIAEQVFKFGDMSDADISKLTHEN